MSFVFVIPETIAIARFYAAQRTMLLQPSVIRNRLA